MLEMFADGEAGTYIFANDFFQGMAQDFPGEDLDILLDVPRLWRRETHDDLEKVITLRLRLRNSERPKAFKIPPNSILLLDGKPHADQRLEQVNGIHARDEAFLPPGPVDAADANTVWCPILWGNRPEVGMDGAPALESSELDQTPLHIELLPAPILGHGIQVAVEFQYCL